MKSLCETLREHTMKIINFKKERNKVINKRTVETISKFKAWSILSRKKVNINMLKIEKCCNFRNHCYYKEKYRGAAHNICNLKYRNSYIFS